MVALALVLYLNILPNTFILDDWFQIFANPFLRDPGGLKKIFTTDVWGFLGQQGVSYFYRPLMHSSFYVIYRLWGAHPAPYHVLSMLLHALTSLLVFALVARASGDRRVALVAGLLFAAHPIHTEDVCWISSYPDLQATLFVLLAWWLYLLSSEAPVQPRWRPWIIPALGVSFFLGLLAKEIAVALPVMVLAHELLVSRVGPWRALRERRWEYLSLAVAGIAYLGLRYHALQGLRPYVPSKTLALVPRLLTSLGLFYRYWAKTLWPAELNVFHDVPVSRSFWEGAVLAGMGSGVLFLWVGYRLWRARRPEVLALALFLVALAPVFVLPYADVGIMLLAERYLYLPSVGFCWLAGWLLVCAGERWGWKPAAGALVVILIAYSAHTVWRNLDWRSEVPFYEKAARMSPQVGELQTQLGNAYLRRNMLPEALAATQRAAALHYESPMLHRTLGEIYSRMGQPEKAIEEYRLSTVYLVDSRYYPSRAARAYTNIGFEYLRMGKVHEAIGAYEQASRLEPESAGWRNNLGYALMRAGRLQEAERELRRSLQSDPTLALAHSNLGLLYALRGALDQADAELAEALRLEPRDAETYARRGEVALARGDRAGAVELFRQALRLQPNQQRAVTRLAELQAK